MSTSRPSQLIPLTLAALAIGLSLFGAMATAFEIWPLARGSHSTRLGDAEGRLGMGLLLIFTLVLAFPGLVAALALRRNIVSAFGLALATSAGCLFLGFAAWEATIAGTLAVQLLGATLCTLAAAGPALLAAWALLRARGRFDWRGRVVFSATLLGVAALAIAWLFNL